jgi:sugar/nucleoside kinase (ribokinase family)
MDFDIILLGNLSKDKIVLPNGDKKESPGGGVYYGAFPLKKMGVRVGVCTKLAKTDSDFFSELTSSIPTFVLPASQTTSIENFYPKEDFSQREQRVLARGEEINLQELPSFNTKIIYFSPLLGEVPPELIKKFSEHSTISLDVQGFVRSMEQDRINISDWPEKREVLPYINILKTDQDEARILAGSDDIKRACKTLASWGPKEVLVTSSDGVYLLADGEFYFREFKPRKILGRTGRGDTCIASYLGKRLEEGPKESLDFAAQITSLKLEEEGPYK